MTSMFFWISLAGMTAAAVLAVLWPLSRKPAFAVAAADGDAAIYRDQLAEIERDRARGLLAGTEADAMHTEVARRLLAASARTEPGASDAASLRRRRIASLLALLVIPVIALSLYLQNGSPERPDMPLAERLAIPLEQQDIGLLVARLESRIAQAPQNGQGWELLAGVYARIGRYEDSIAAHENALRLLGSSPARETAYGEVLTATANGTVTPQARAAFERALAKDPDFPAALYYYGIAAEQEGDRASARERWMRVIEKAPPNDPWRIPAARALQRTGGEK